MKVLTLMSIAFLVSAPSFGQGEWKSRGDFSGTQGYHNWYYLQRNSDGSYTQMTYDGAKWVGSETSLQIGQIISHPGNTKDAVRKWVAPSSMRIKITGTVNKTSTNGDGVLVKYTIDPSQDWEIPLWQLLIGGSDVSKKNYDICIWIEQGEAIYFSVNKNATTTADPTDFNITIDSLPTYDIHRLNIADQSDPSVTGSIAWNFQTHGSEATYRLVDDDQAYIIDHPLTIPKRVSLINGSGSQFASLYMTARAQDASNDQYRETMVYLNDESSIRGLKINAQGAAKRIVMSKIPGQPSSKYFRIDKCLLQNSRNNYSKADSTQAVRPDILYMDAAQFAIIKNNTLRNAGYNPSQGGEILPNCWPERGKAALIYAPGTNYTAFIHNDIANALTHGITFGSSTNVLVYNNYIQNTDMNYLYCTGCEAGDGISAYHHVPNDIICNYLILNDTIYHSHNHGIHVTGTNVFIENNLVRSTTHGGILMSDWRDTPDYTPRVISHDCTISGNNVDGSGDNDIEVDYACFPTITIQNNISDPVAYGIHDICSDFPILKPEQLTSDQTTILAYPNPVQDVIQIQSPSIDSQVHVAIADESGSIVLRAELNSSNPKLDIHSLKPGIYYMKFISSGQEHVVRILKR